MYLLSRGSLSMENCCHGNNQDMLLVATTSNWLGWDSFIEGGISTQWIPMVTPLLACTSPHLLAKTWGRHLAARLHNVIHKQWIYKNSIIHYKGKDGHTIPEHHDILNCVEDILWPILRYYSHDTTSCTTQILQLWAVIQPSIAFYDWLVWKQL
jgi:hypothetical protein